MGDEHSDGVAANRDLGDFSPRDDAEDSPVSAEVDVAEATVEENDVGSDEEEDQTTEMLKEALAGEEAIFQNYELLEVGYIPEDDRIVGRTHEISELVGELARVIKGREGTNLFLYGKSGVGKSLCTAHVLVKAKNLAESMGNTLEKLTVDCNEHDTETQVVRYVLKQIVEMADIEFDGSVPDAGYPTGYYYSKLWPVLDDTGYDGLTIILDEVDRLDPEQCNDLLYEFSRAGEKNKTECKIGIVCISNDQDYLQQATENRTKSTLQPQEVVFDPYDATQLREILRKRQDAFSEGVLTDDVIPLCAAFAAQDHGDARKAIDTFRNAGDLAMRDKSDVVKEKHVRLAQEKVEIDRYAKLAQGLPTQEKISLLSVTTLCLHSDETWHPTAEVVQFYEMLCNEIDADERTHWTVRDVYLDDLEFLGFLKSQKGGGGRNRPPFLQFTLTNDATITRDILLSDSRISELSDILEQLYERHANNWRYE